MHIGFIKRLGAPYDYVYTKYRPWLSHMKRELVGPDEAIVAYIRYMYPDVKVSVFTRNSFKNTEKCDIVFLGFEEITLPFKKLVLQKKQQGEFDAYMKSLKKITNLYPKLPFAEFIVDKCRYYRWLDSIDIKVSPTLCVKLGEKTSPTYVKQRLRPKEWNKVFVKPLPGAEGTNVRSFNANNLRYKKGNLNHHIEYLKNRGFTKVVAQKFMENFATAEHPELRTFWVGNEYQYTIETTGAGYDWNVRKSPIPNSLYLKCKKVLKHLAEKFRQELIITRLDWGYDKGSFFLNEIEYAPGTFAEMFPGNKWKLDKKIGDRIIKIARTKVHKVS